MSSNNRNNSINNQSDILQGLMGRLQLHPSYLLTNSFLSQPFDDFLLPNPNTSESINSSIAIEEAKVEKEIIRRILNGETDSLQPNSGQAVSIGDHHICVAFHEESERDCRAWEWHGHILLYNDENGYTPEYIYGNYFERFAAKEGGGNDMEEEEDGGGWDVGLLGLIGERDLTTNGRILGRNLNARRSNV